MAGVEGMPFLGGNKEGGGFYSHDMDEAGSTDFFDQFVMLDGEDTETSVGDGGLGLGHFGVSELSISPHPLPSSSSSIEPSIQAPVASSAGNRGGAVAAGSINLGGRPPATIGSNVSHHVGPPNVKPARLQQFQHQQLNRLQRTTSNMADYTIKPSDIDLDGGLPYTNSTFAEPFGSGCAGGTVSDSELLKLEGLTMRSPRVDPPPQPASLPASPPSMTASPRKPGRFEAFCSRFRNKTAGIQGKFKQQSNGQQQQLNCIKQEPDLQQQTSIMSTAQIGPTKSSSSRPKPTHLNLPKSQLPLSPPLTGGPGPMTAPLPQSINANNFITTPSFLDDPFLQDQMLRGQFIPHTPAHLSQQHSHNPLDAIWSVSTTPIFSSSDLAANTSWWDPDIQMDTDISLSLAFHQAATTQAAAQVQAQQHLFEYPPPPPSPLMSIQMPHPPHQQSSSSSTSRRPKPRAPSSGARHHHHHSNSLSPRKTRSSHNLREGGASAASSSSSSSSPTKSHHNHRRVSSSSSLNGSSGGGNVIRKRQSWSTSNARSEYQNQHGAARRVSSSSSSSALQQQQQQQQHGAGLYRSSGGKNRTGSCSSLILGAGMDSGDASGFVNYTPQDRTLLMTGVAPSGSSKTKARREKEAQERDREYKERLQRAVEAAGGDLKKLEELTRAHQASINSGSTTINGGGGGFNGGGCDGLGGGEEGMLC
ncbi:hypothetical protein QBC43DRAFT_296235 [Cladorrhinum sp. PSN259]|nr:hypothetical protein QBC43DRAFT_296235 [Cladorrhinum sp. PSN259]